MDEIELRKYLGMDVTRGIKLAPQDPMWREIFKRILFPRLKKSLKKFPVNYISHVGSTAIETISHAKPILDVAVLLDHKLQESQNLRDEISWQLHYDGILTSGDHRFFDSNHHPNILIAACPEDSNIYMCLLHLLSNRSNIQRTMYNDLVRFRDFMNVNPDKAAEYVKFKEEAILKYKSITDYNDSKGSFVERILKEEKEG